MFFLPFDIRGHRIHLNRAHRKLPIAVLPMKRLQGPGLSLKPLRGTGLHFPLRPPTLDSSTDGKQMSVVAGAANLKRRTVLVLEHCRQVGVQRAANRWHQQRFPVLGTKDEMDVELREGSTSVP